MNILRTNKADLVEVTSAGAPRGGMDANRFPNSRGSGGGVKDEGRGIRK